MKRWCIAWIVCWLTTQVWAEVRVVYHLSDGVAQASRAMNNIRNHLTADPTVKIVVVAHGAGLERHDEVGGELPHRARPGPDGVAVAAALPASAQNLAIVRINSIGNVGGMVSTSVVGWITDVTGNAQNSLILFGGMLLISVVLVLKLPSRLVNH